jgi:hypothetical protein
MKRFIALLTCAAVTFSSVRADEAPPLPPVDNQNMTPDQTGGNSTPPSGDDLATSPELSDDNTAAPTNDGKKQVGEAADDGSKTAGSGAGKYVLAACAIAVGIAALILVSRHSGHKQ